MDASSILDAPSDARGPSKEELLRGRTKKSHVEDDSVRGVSRRVEANHLAAASTPCGNVASSVDLIALTEISEIRQSLEPPAIRLACHRLNAADRSDLTALRAALNSAPADINAPAQMEWDLRVHRALYKACHNEQLQNALIHHGNLVTRIWSTAAPRLLRMKSCVTELTFLLDAVLAGDTAEAERLMSEHVRDLESRLRAVL